MLSYKKFYTYAVMGALEKMSCTFIPRVAN